jgi:capsular polysaccharide biosynthesis protein
MDVTDAPVTAQARPVGVDELARIPLRRWRAVLATTVLLTVGAAGYVLFAPTTWTATSVVVIRPVVTDPFSLPNGGADRAVNMTAENGIATGNDVIDKVAAATRWTVADVADALTVENPVGGQVLRFSFDGDSPSVAMTGANTAATTYLQVRRTMYDAQRKSVLKSYDATIALVTAERKKTQRDLPDTVNAAGTSPRSSALLDQMRSLNDQLATLAEQRSKVASADLSPGVVTIAARAPLPSSGDAAPMYLLAAVLGGLILGTVVAFVRESLDRRIRSAVDAVDATGAPLLGSVHRAPRGTDGNATDMRYLALSVASWTEDQPGRPLVMLSEREDEGRVQVSAGLAAALAEAGHEVYLGATDEAVESLRDVLLAAQRRASPVITRHRVPRVAHAASQLVDAVNAAVPDSALNAMQPVGRATPPVGRATLPVGRATPAAVNGMGTTTMFASETSYASDPDRLLAAPGSRAAVPIRDEADLLHIGSGSVRLGPLETDNPEQLIILDGPPAEADDRGVWAARSGRAVLVGSRDRTRTAALSRLADRVRAAGVRPLGVILTGAGRD